MSRLRTALLWSASLAVVSLCAMRAVRKLRNDHTRGVALAISLPTVLIRICSERLFIAHCSDGALSLSSQVLGRHRQVVNDTVSFAVF